MKCITLGTRYTCTRLFILYYNKKQPQKHGVHDNRFDMLNNNIIQTNRNEFDIKYLGLIGTAALTTVQYT